MTMRTVALLATLAAAACSPRLIPGTPIPSTADNRAVYGVLRTYAEGLQAKDAAAVLAVVAPDYFDSAGTPQPEDDLDRAALERALPADLAKVDSLRIQIAVKKIEVEGDRARAELVYEGFYRVVTREGTVPKRESNLNQMLLRRIGKDWKITSGL